MNKNRQDDMYMSNSIINSIHGSGQYEEIQSTEYSALI